MRINRGNQIFFNASEAERYLEMSHMTFRRNVLPHLKAHRIPGYKWTFYNKAELDPYREEVQVVAGRESA